MVRATWGSSSTRMTRGRRRSARAAWPAAAGDHARHRAELADQLGAVADLVAGQPDRGVDDIGERERHALLLLRPAERAQALDDLAHALGAVARVVDRGGHLDAVALARPAPGHLERLGERLEVARDVGERVVDLVRDAGRERAQARHPV